LRQVGISLYFMRKMHGQTTHKSLVLPVIIMNIDSYHRSIA